MNLVNTVIIMLVLLNLLGVTQVGYGVLVLAFGLNLVLGFFWVLAVEVFKKAYHSEMEK